MGVPCLTMRPNTERPITITQGTNRLCIVEDLEKYVDEIFLGKTSIKNEIELWDGQTASRVVQSVFELQ